MAQRHTDGDEQHVQRQLRDYEGGAIFDFQSKFTLTNSTLTGNHAVFGGGGIGRLQGGSGSVMARSLVSGNTTGNPDGDFPGSGLEIFLDNSPPAAVNDLNNLIGHDGDSGSDPPFVQSSSVPGVPVAAILDTTLADNGGPTSTHALVPGSPALDAIPLADAGCTGFDQRGVTRPSDSGCDIGAYEDGVVPTTPTPTPTAAPTATPTPPPTATPTNTPQPTATPEPTNTPEPTPTNTPVPLTATPTNTPVPPTATPTNTPVPPTATPTRTPTASNTPVPTATNTPPPSSSACNGLTPTILGTNGNNKLVGTAGNDVIQALGGNDIIDGKGGNDVICGGAGNDAITGGTGDDVILAGTGNDAVSGDAGNDTIFGGDGHDGISGGAGKADKCFGEDGIDVLVLCESGKP